MHAKSKSLPWVEVSLLPPISSLEAWGGNEWARENGTAARDGDTVKVVTLLSTEVAQFFINFQDQVAQFSINFQDGSTHCSSSLEIGTVTKQLILSLKTTIHPNMDVHIPNVVYWTAC